MRKRNGRQASIGVSKSAVSCKHIAGANDGLDSEMYITAHLKISRIEKYGAQHIHTWLAGGRFISCHANA